MNTIKVKISQLKNNPNNPRYIKDNKFKLLVDSLKEFPEMLEKGPLVCYKDEDGKYIILGGNMRLKALKQANIKEIPILLANEWTENQRNQFIIKDNLSFGEWDWDALANEWSAEDLSSWGLNLPIFQDDLSNTSEYKGMNPDLELDNFMNAEIKRFYLAYESETFEKVVEWFEKNMKKYKCTDYSNFILYLIENEKT